jgi:hypothetical protein
MIINELLPCSFCREMKNYLILHHNVLISFYISSPALSPIFDQAATNQFQDGARQGDFLYDQFSKEKEFWFDFMADTGDGGNSTYTVARLLAQPSIRCISTSNSELDLPRGNLLLIGGDLA